jgi:hypothetical protein
MSDKEKKAVDAYLATIDRIEPDVHPIDASAFYASAAISLKRIADQMEAFVLASQTLHDAFIKFGEIKPEPKLVRRWSDEVDIRAINLPNRVLNSLLNYGIKMTGEIYDIPMNKWTKLFSNFGIQGKADLYLALYDKGDES